MPVRPQPDEGRSRTGAAPNILVILSDQHNRRVMGCAGDSIVRTPHLDRLAEQGTRFDSAYCGSPLCVPSRATFLTGQSCSELSVWTNSSQLNSSVPTFAHALAIAGFDTVLAGRMHFTGPDQRHGFATRLVGDVSPPAGGHPDAVLRGLPRGGNRQDYTATAISGPGRTAYQAYDKAVTDATVRWIRDRAASGSDRPFCLVVGMLMPHNPYIAPPALYDDYVDRVDVPPVPDEYWSTLHPAVRHWRTARRVDELTDDQARSARAAYYGLVTILDEQVGQIVAALNDSGQRDQTAVIYTSDHGDMAGELGMWWKSSCYEGSVGVPLIASWPEKWPSKHVISAPVSLTDIAPTLAELGNAPTPPHASGTSLVPLLASDTPPEHWLQRPVFAENVPALASPPARMVRRGQWKFVHHHGFDHPQLFDLDADPAESRDLGTDPAHAAIRDDLHELAVSDWNGDDVVTQTNRHAEQAQLLQKWAHETQPPEPDQWWPPPGSNVFPEPTSPADDDAVPTASQFNSER